MIVFVTGKIFIRNASDAYFLHTYISSRGQNYLWPIS